MKAITVITISVLVGIVLTVGMVMPAVVYMDRDAEMPDTDGGRDIFWLCPVFDDTGTVRGHTGTYTPTGITREMYEASWHDKDTVRIQIGNHGYNVPDCPSEVICNLSSSVRANGMAMDNLTDREKCIVIQSFVANGIHYREDTDLYGCRDFASTPLETLYLGMGDCEDVAILFVSIARAYGIESTLLLMDGHCMAGVVLEGYTDTLGGYVPIECTHTSYGISRPMSYPEAEGEFERAMDGGIGDTVANLWLRYGNRIAPFNPILFIARMLS